MQVNYFHFIAEEIRAGLASLGMRSLDDLTGRSDLLRQRDHPLSKTTGLDLSFISRFVGPCKNYGDRKGAEVALEPMLTASHLAQYLPRSSRISRQSYQLSCNAWAELSVWKKRFCLGNSIATCTWGSLGPDLQLHPKGCLTHLLVFKCCWHLSCQNLLLHSLCSTCLPAIGWLFLFHIGLDH